MKNPIETMWESYLKKVVPNDAGPTQIEETKQAFFAGASILFTVIMGSLSSGSEPEESDLSMLDDIQKEIDNYGHALDKRVFGTKEH